MCLSTLPSRAAISASDATRPSTMSSIQLRALAIASLVSGFIEVRDSAGGRDGDRDATWTETTSAC